MRNIKKIFSYLGITTLALMSFIATEKTITVIKETDDIMVKINEEKNKYEKKPINAKIEENKIIPGINGKKININKSYEEMKKFGKYDPEKYEYEEIKPEKSIEKIYDKYIELGNPNKKEIAIIIIINNNDEIPMLKKIQEKQNVKVTILKNNEMQNQNYCYTKEESSLILKKCTKQKRHTIIINPIERDLKKETKKILSNGKIITISLNDNTKQQLELTINFIKNKGYKIVKLEELLSEKNTN